MIQKFLIFFRRYFMKTNGLNKESISGLPGSIKADFPCTFIAIALVPSPADCQYYYTKSLYGIIHEFCGELELSTRKGVKGGSWSIDNLPPCYLCTKYKKKVSV